MYLKKCVDNLIKFCYNKFVINTNINKLQFLRSDKNVKNS